MLRRRTLRLQQQPAGEGEAAALLPTPPGADLSAMERAKAGGSGRASEPAGLKLMPSVMSDVVRPLGRGDGSHLNVEFASIL